MKVYTYCSYKGSYNGYQYAFWDSSQTNGKVEISSVLSCEGTEGWPREFSYIKSMMEHNDGWKIILKKQSSSEGILLIYQIEKAADAIKLEWKDRYETARAKEHFTGKAEDRERIQLNEMEPQFFMNIGLSGKWESLKAFAVYYILDLIDGKSQGTRLMNHMNCILKKSPDRERYLVNFEEWRCLEQVVKEQIKTIVEDKSEVEYVKNGHKGLKDFLIYKINSERINPYVRLRKGDEQIGIRERRKKVRQMVVDKLLRKTDFSQEYVLVVTDGGEPKEAKDSNMVFDMDYILG